MKKRMKQMAAAFLTLAMILSLSVTAFATVGTPAESNTNTVTSEGAPPDDLTRVVMPTAADNQFNMYFDTFGMILETNADRYADRNSNHGIEEIEDSRFYFLNNVTTGADLTDTLAVDFGSGDTLVKAGTKVVKYTKAAATGGLTKIYAKPDTYGETYSWVKVSSSNAVDTVDADWAANGAYEKIASLKSLDPKSGAGLDTIAALNKSDPDLYLRVGATALDSTAAAAAGSADLVGCFEYTFVASYSDYTTTPTDTCFVLFKDDGNVEKVFSTKGTAAAGGNAATAPTEATGSTTFDDFEDSTDSDNNVKDAILTISSADYYRQRESRAVFSLKKTSVPLKIINKTNADLGVSVSAELVGIPGGDGSKPAAGAAQTYVYAKDYDATTGKFYDDVATETTRNVIQGGPDGVPVFYLALTDGTDTEPMVYDSTANKATVSIGSLIAGRPDLFEKAWDSTVGTGGAYTYKENDPATRERDFNSKEFYFVGAIDDDNPAWNTLGASPNAKVTWKLETITPPAAPTVTPPATITSKSAATFTITNNTDALVFVSAKQGDTEVDPTKITVTNDANTGATTDISFAKGTISGTEDVVFTFRDQQKAFLTKTVTVSFGG